MHVGILGPLEVVAAGQVVEVGGARLRALLIRLALDAGRVVTVEALAQALWPDRRPRDPAHALQSLMSRLRGALPSNAAVRSTYGGYCLDLPPEDVDVLRFERLVNEGRHALRNGDVEDAASRLREALRLWRGEPLAEVADAPYATAVTVRLRELRLNAIEDRVAADLMAGLGPASLVAELEELTALHPLRERLRVLLVRALHADGRHAEALTAYDDVRRLLADELGSDPGPELRRAHLAVLRDEEIPRRRAGVRRPGNLPTGLSSFVGREVEQRRITAQVTDGRLVTLVGPGGVGKTRLSTAVAAGLTDGRADGLAGGRWLVELAGVADPDGVPGAVIDALGLREAGPLDAGATPRDALSRLVGALSSAETVIVLDNCEHVIDAAASLAEALLNRCPLLRIIATSREALGIDGEILCPVPPLGLPEPGASAAQALACAAVRLFADRATAVRPGFTVDEDNVAAVIDICRRLDGLPLAIELAAARLRSLAVDELSARLVDRFAVLTGGSRTALPRHRTLHAVIEWSWDLLTDGERRLARRLAAFPGDVGLESAERVAGGSLDQLTALVDKSLLEFDGTRYRMLETIREYGLKELADGGELAEVKAAHAAYCLDLARRGEPHLRGAGQVPWFHTLRSEQVNLLGALRFACDSGDAATAVELAAALGLFWTLCGNHAEAANRLRLALAVPGEAAPETRTIATAFYLFNAVLSGHPRTGDAIDPVPAESDGASRHVPHPAAALFEPALAVFDNDTAAGLAAVDRLLSHPDPWTRAMLRFMRVLLRGGVGGLAAMRPDLRSAVTAFRAAGERWGLAQSLTYLAYGRITLGEVDAAIAGLDEATRLLRELDPTDDAGLQRVLLATAYAQVGRTERARAELLDLVASDATRSSAGFLAFARTTLGDLARRDGDLEEAARHLDRAAEALDRAALDMPPFRAMLTTARGHLAVADGDQRAAQRHLREAIGAVVDLLDPPVAAGVAVAAARLCASRGAAHDAAELLGAAHALRGTPDSSNPDVVDLARELRAGLGDHGYQTAYAQGGALDGAGALTLIEARLGPPSRSSDDGHAQARRR